MTFVRDNRMSFPKTEISDIINATMQNRSAKMAEMIMRDPKLAGRFGPPTRWQRICWAILRAWPLRWKRDDDGYN